MSDYLRYYWNWSLNLSWRKVHRYYCCLKNVYNRCRRADSSPYC